MGLAVADVGLSSIDATGDVYHLTRLEDFNGTYAAAGAGATLVGGGSIVTMQNGQGVVVQLRSRQTGVRLSLGLSGITMSVVEYGADMSVHHGARLFAMMGPAIPHQAEGPQAIEMINVFRHGARAGSPEVAQIRQCKSGSHSISILPPGAPFTAPLQPSGQ